MKVLLDPQVFVWQRYGGVSRLFAELYREFVQHDHGIELIVPPWIGDNPYAREYGMPQRSPIIGPGFPGKTRAQVAVSRALVRRRLDREPVELFHPTYYDPYFLRFVGNTPFLLTVYDLIHEVFAGSYMKAHSITREAKKKLLARAARVVAISETTKADLVRLYGISAEKIDVAYLSNSLKPTTFGVDQSERLVEKPYLLFVGQRKAYKNFDTFLAAAAPIAVRRDFSILCVGGPPFDESEAASIEQLGISDRIRHRFLNEKELVSAYRDAEAFVYPSRYEGFGMPVLEAFACRCPVVLSDIPTFREIAADAALFFDPDSPAELTARLDEVLDSTELRSKLLSRATSREAAFSWDSSARATAAAYRASLR
jgi:glycosyltransferase involved in cell wall biosynthesis